MYNENIYGDKMMVQLSLFSKTIDTVYLLANSPRQAFYRLSLISDFDQVRLKKEWGTKQKTHGSREKVYKSLQKAEKELARTIREKTNPNRKSKRIYNKVNVNSSINKN
ncbi:MAG: hypothetical protein OMM_10286 [Candidatus Magnetoglobus multicellularis str. Araruama]|uniref:WGR domain-containing protein n=1 Tax=Candidatus Magnetoglobus multicellularis str. Araruama TaxID=890399 RepID=A0A1V1P1C5_9BACT|nr:MAG: hypothetical protein OMM_10286 [Candidatus Magnetoglobus multicellularis str. Araruama]